MPAPAPLAVDESNAEVLEAEPPTYETNEWERVGSSESVA